MGQPKLKRQFFLPGLVSILLSLAPFSVSAQVSPLLNTAWDQTCYYNDSCPPDPVAPPNLCGKVWVGCVATAMGQLMHYHSWPLQGQGSNSYFSIYYGQQTADFGATTYDWALMPNVLNQASPEVARLLYHCGVSVNMNYHLLGSGALTSSAGNALKTYFGYDSSLALHFASTYTPSAWIDLLKNELDSARPVIYRAEQSGGGAGHAWVMDGYDGAGLFHSNWGWGGYYNGYYNLNALHPNLNNFNQNQGALIGIRPAANLLRARFTASGQTAALNETLDFTDLSPGSPQSWEWQFQGAVSPASSQQHPQGISWAQAGKYGIRLIVGDGNGNYDTLFKPNYITITPLPDFMASEETLEAGMTVDFTNLSITKYPITQYQWLFPGGTPGSSNQENPGGITYSVPGQYDVSLTITTTAGSHTQLKSNFISVYSNCDTLFYHNGKSWFADPSIGAGFIFSAEDLDQLTPYFAGAPYFHTSSWNTFNDGNINPSDTNYFQGAASFFTPPGQANNWLSFGPFPGGGNGWHFSWRHYFWDNDKRDGYAVYASPLGTGHAQFIQPPLLVFGDNDPATDGDTLWKSHSLFLPDSMGGTNGLYLAFQHFANNQFYLFLDDIRVFRCTGLPVPSYSIQKQDGPLLYPTLLKAGEPFYVLYSNEGTSPAALEIEILDTDGRLLRKQALSTGDAPQEIQSGQLRPGLYLVRIFAKEQVFVKRIIIAG